MSYPRTRQLVTRSLSFIFFFLFSTFGAFCAFALDPSLDVSQYAHTSWKIRDGFVPGTINAVAQTPDGYLWLGTELGLYRFDGVRAARWQPPAGEQLPSDSILSLLVARNGTLWVATKSGLASLRDGNLTLYPEVAGQFLFTLLQDREGTIWFGAQAPGRLCAIRGGKVQCYGAGTFGRSLMVLYEDRPGNLWLSSNTGLWRWETDIAEHYEFPRGVNSVDALIEGDNNSLLMATNAGLKQLVSGRIRDYTLPGVIRKFRPSRLCRDRDGSVWIGGFQGILHLHQGRVDAFGAPDGLSSDFTFEFFEDREGTVWVGTQNGLDRFREYVVSTISRAQGLPHSFAISLQAAPDGNIWFITPVGLNYWHDDKLAVYTAPGAIAPIRSRDEHGDGSAARLSIIANSGLLGFAQCLALDGKKRLWVGTNQGLFYLEHGRFVGVPRPATGEISFLAGDVDGNLWISYPMGLSFRTATGGVEQISWSRLGQKNFGARVLLPDSLHGGIWLGFVEGGTALFWGGQVRNSYTTADGLGRGRVNDLRFGPGGALWAGTEGGLSHIKDGHVSTLTSKNGLPCDNVEWSMEDDEHFTWLYTGCGLVRIASSDLDNWTSNPTQKLESTIFDASDGVRNAADFSGYGPRVTKSPDGRIWFLPGDGVGVIDPRHLPYNKIPPPVQVEQITADGKVYDAANGVQLPRLVRYVDIDYTALSLVVPEKVRFRVKLEGEDKDWRELVNVRRVSYTNLGPKHYRFLVKACNNSGVWNEEGAALDFVIPPAWYQTYWFLAACVAAFLALLWALYQYRLHQLAQQFNMRLEERVGERTRIARDLHDTLLQSFHGILLFLQSGIHLMPEHPAEGMKTLKKAAEQAERAIIEGREAVQGLRASTVERNDLALAIKTLGGELAAADSNSHRAEFNVQVEGIPRELHPILRDEVFRIGGEAMRNAFRHADAKQIEVEIRYDERQLRLRVRDDGKGIDPKLLSHDGREGHFGLRGMRERAKLIGGKLTVWSELDSGTEVELSIPASRAYTAPSDGQRSWLAEKFAKISQRDTERKS